MKEKGRGKDIDKAREREGWREGEKSKERKREG